MHPTEEEIQRLLHGELSRAEEESVRAHLAECADCRTPLAELGREEDEVRTLLRRLDHSIPHVEAGVIAKRAASRESAGQLRRAALILVGLGLVGASFAAPGSPLRDWLDAAIQRARPEAPSTPSTSPAPSDARSVSGIAVHPGQSLVISITSARGTLPAGGGTARVSLTHGAQVVVRGPSGAATYSTEADRLIVTVRESSFSTFEIEIPRSAPRVEIRIDEERAFLKEGDRVSTSAAANAEETYVLPFSASDGTSELNRTPAPAASPMPIAP